MEMQFGIPSKRKRKEEDPNPIMTLEYTGEKGTARKITLNTAACNLLGIESTETVFANYIAFSFVNEMKIPAIANVSHNFELFKDAALPLSKSLPHSINSSKYYDYILEYFSSEDIVGVFKFYLESTELDKVCKFSLIGSEPSNSEIEDVETHTEHGGELEEEQLIEESI